MSCQQTFNKVTGFSLHIYLYIDADKLIDPLGRQVVIQDMRIVVDNRPDIILPLSTPEYISQISTTKIIVKEGTPYNIVVNFRVYKDIVLGLKCTNIVKKLGIKVDTVKQMIGSYAPKATEYSYTFPKDEFASGILARCAYSSTTMFTDDDGTTHLSFSWSFEIRKDWV